MNTPSLLQTDLISCAELAKALGHPHRLALLDSLTTGELAVESLAELSGLSLANASQHLQQLKRLGLVESRRVGKRVFYRLGSGPLPKVLDAMRAYVLYQQDIVRELVSAPNQGDVVSISELIGRMRDESTVLLDVRPSEEFEGGHLPGAINVSLDDLISRLQSIPADAKIVAYCRGAFCMLSSEAVKLLRLQGRQAFRLAGGPEEWRAAQEAGMW